MEVELKILKMLEREISQALIGFEVQSVEKPPNSVADGDTKRCLR